MVGEVSHHVSLLDLLFKKVLLLCQSAQLPVGGGAGVEDVLFGREQRQAVGIKVNRFLVHDAQNFPERSASFVTGPDGVRGSEFLLGRKIKKNKKKTPHTATAERQVVDGGGGGKKAL